MAKFKVILHYPDGEDEELDEIFDSEKQADEAGLYASYCYEVGAETLNMSNPGDYYYDEDNFDELEFEVIEIDD